MGLLHLLVAALAVGAASAADPCACVNPDQKINSISAPMLFFQQPTEGGATYGKTCNTNCVFTASLDSDDPKYTLQVQLLTNNKLGGATITIDGMNDTITIYSTTQPQIFSARSYGDSITITFKEGDATELSEFMLVVSKVDGPRPDPPKEKTTTTSAPTPPYDPVYTHNPKLVANDIMLAFDLSSPDLEKFKAFSSALVNELAIKPKSLDVTDEEDCDTGSRLSLVGLSAISGFNNLYAPYWTSSDVQAVGNIGSFVQISSGAFYYKPVGQTYIYGYNREDGAGDDKAFTLCENRGKIFILLTSSAPAEYDPLKSNDGGASESVVNFLDNGVHQILVYANMDPKNMTYYDKYYNTSIPTSTYKDNDWSYFQLGDTDKSVQSFINKYLVDSSEDMTCQLKSKSEQTQVPIGKDRPTPADPISDTNKVPVVNINLPAYYNAKGITGKWGTVRHYCNFQETTIKLVRDENIDNTNPVPVCVKVYYDLETGKDFVSIFSGNPAEPGTQKEVVRLTGRDVSGTSFDLPDTYGSIVFSSDEKNVFDGFHAEITRGECE